MRRKRIKRHNGKPVKDAAPVLDPSLEKLAAMLERDRAHGRAAARLLSATAQKEAPMRDLNDDRSKGVGISLPWRASGASVTVRPAGSARRPLLSYSCRYPRISSWPVNSNSSKPIWRGSSIGYSRQKSIPTLTTETIRHGRSPVRAGVHAPPSRERSVDTRSIAPATRVLQGA